MVPPKGDHKLPAMPRVELHTGEGGVPLALFEQLLLPYARTRRPPPATPYAMQFGGFKSPQGRAGGMQSWPPSQGPSVHGGHQGLDPK